MDPSVRTSREQGEHAKAHVPQVHAEQTQELRMLELRLEHEAEEAAKNRRLERTKVLIQYGLGALAVAAVSAAATIITQQMTAHEREIERAREDIRFAHENFWKAIELYADAERRAPVLRFLVAADAGQLGGWANAELKRDEPVRAALEEARKQLLDEVETAAKELERERTARVNAEREARDAEQKLVAIRRAQREAEELARRADAEKAKSAAAEQRRRVVQLEADKRAAEQTLEQAKAEAVVRLKAEDAARLRRITAANAAKGSAAPTKQEAAAPALVTDPKLVQTILTSRDLMEAIRKSAAQPQR